MWKRNLFFTLLKFQANYNVLRRISEFLYCHAYNDRTHKSTTTTTITDSDIYLLPPPNAF